MPVVLFELVLSCLSGGDFKPIEEWVIEKKSEGYSFRADRLFIGNGTGLRFFSRKLEDKNIIYNIIDERHTTSEGRRLYWKLNPPCGLWKVVPLSLRVPPRSVDDLAAWAILKRGIGGGTVRYPRQVAE
jgi:hypothetical protein